MSPAAVQKNVLGTRIAYVPHPRMNALCPTLKIIRIIVDSVRSKARLENQKVVREAAEQRFLELGLSAKLLDRYAFELTGVEKQLVAIAVSTFPSPKVVVADDPCAGLDPPSQKRILRMLDDMTGKGMIKSLILMTKVLPLLYNIADEIMVMCGGKMMEKGTEWEITCDPIHPYSKALVDAFAMPGAGVKERKPSVFLETPPFNTFQSRGCRFALRCPYVTGKCLSAADIPMKPYGKNREYRCVMTVEQLRKIG